MIFTGRFRDVFCRILVGTTFICCFSGPRLLAQIPTFSTPPPASAETPPPAAPPTVVVVPTHVEAPPAGTEPAEHQPPAIRIQTVSPPPTLTDKEKEALEEQKEVVSRMPNPNDLIDYFLDKYTWKQYERAYACIDFGTMNPSDKTKRRIVYMLTTVLSRLDGKDVYDYPTAESTMDQEFHSPQGMVELHFVRGEHHNWQFANTTIREIDRYYELLRNEPPIRLSKVMRVLPQWALQPVFGVPAYRVLLVASAFFLGFILKILVEWFLFKMNRWLFNLLLQDWDRSKLTRKTWLPAGLWVLLSFWYFGFSVMLSNPDDLDFLYSLYVVFTVMMGIWMSFRIVDLFALWLRLRMRHRDPNIDIIFFPLFTRTTKVLIVCMGLITLAGAFHWPLVGLVSGMGIGGIAIAFAAKETIANLFGSVTVLADRPFVIGDWIVTGDIEGTVESVGMRSTRIRTFYNSLVTIPNNNLTTAVIDNMGARYYRRYRTYLSLPIDTEPERIEAFCEGIRELIRRHPYTRKDLYHVYLNEFKPYSLDILLNVFFVCPDTSIEFRERGRLIADILRLARELGVRFALPTQIQHNIESQAEIEAPFEADPVAAGREAATKIYPLEE